MVNEIDIVNNSWKSLLMRLTMKCHWREAVLNDGQHRSPSSMTTVQTSFEDEQGAKLTIGFDQGAALYWFDQLVNVDGSDVTIEAGNDENGYTAGTGTVDADLHFLASTKLSRRYYYW